MGKNAVLQITLRATGSEDRRVCNSEKRTIGQHTWDTNVRIFATIDADPGANKSAIIRAISYSPATARDYFISFPKIHPQNITIFQPLPNGGPLIHDILMMLFMTIEPFDI